MEEIPPVSDVLMLEPMPKLAEALRAGKERILARWDHLVKQHLPDADALTSQEVRNSIPGILDQMARALEADNPAPVERLIQVTKVHGEVRFHESYNLDELMMEYRLLRRVLVEEVDACFAGVVSSREWIALDVAVDIAMQQAVLSFLKHQRAQLQSATAAEAKFLAFLSHDLRNGLNNILLSMLWVERSIRPYKELGDQAEGLESARAAATETIATMERMLQAERLRKHVAVQTKRVVLADLGQEIVNQFQSAANAKGITLATQIPAEAIVESDPGLLLVILQNFAANAIKYSEGGSVRVEAVQKEDAWELAVSDQGKGISGENQKRLFEAFSRGETHGQPGVGLGLYIAAQAARNLAVKIQVESLVGSGSRFSVRLPV